MTTIDWLVLFVSLVAIVVYGVVKTRGSHNMETYLRGDNTLKWWMIGLSIMATQASAITFLSTPGQAVEDGMRFIQFYFGLPLAMILISAVFVPVYYRLNVLTAYEFLEQRFDLKTRAFTAILFLLLRGLSAGITIFAPSLVLATVLHWPVELATVLIGLLVMIYSVSGGSKAVSLTQRLQLSIVMGGMLLAGIIAYTMLPKNLDFIETIKLAGYLGKLNLINILPADAAQNLPTGVNSVNELSLIQKIDLILEDRFNIWSGMIASVFLFLSYFGTDQSQVGRYLGGRNLTESRMGLMFNGLLKIPMQFVILFIGVLVFIFYLFNQPPVFHNQVLYQKARSAQPDKLAHLESKYDTLFSLKHAETLKLVQAIEDRDHDAIALHRHRVRELEQAEKVLREEVRTQVAMAVPGAKTQDRDYIFLNFVLHYLPHGIVGLLLAVMFLAAMSSVAGELSALASTTSVDIYRRLIVQNASARHYLRASRTFSVVWTMLAVVFAVLASFAENLIQFVNIVGSLFYGTILGVFIVAFFIRYVRGTAVFLAAVFSELIVLYCYFYTDIAFLLYNIIGCVCVVLTGIVLQGLFNSKLLKA